VDYQGVYDLVVFFSGVSGIPMASFPTFAASVQAYLSYQNPVQLDVVKAVFVAVHDDTHVTGIFGQ